MVEVFKTNVNEPFHADILVRFVHNSFNDHRANFDLEDRDKILRVESLNTIKTNNLIDLIRGLGFEIEILSDDLPGFSVV